MDWQAAGDGLITRSVGQGLDWLDVTYTIGQSYDTTLSQMGVGGILEGFRYATGAEILTLANQNGFVGGDLNGETNNNNPPPSWKILMTAVGVLHIAQSAILLF